MRFSAFTDILDRPFEAALDALAGVGLGTVDLRSRLGADNVDSLGGDAARQVAQAIAARGLEVGCVASWGVNPINGDYDPADPDYRRAMRQRTEQLAALAEGLGAANVRVYSFKRPGGAREAGPGVTEADRTDNAA